MKIFVTGINGFIGSHFLEMALAQTDWEIQGFDLNDNNITQFLDNPRFSMHKGDIFKEEAWLNEQIKACDVLLPLIGIARPAYYISRPLWTFELDFEQNLKWYVNVLNMVNVLFSLLLLKFMVCLTLTIKLWMKILVI